MLNGRAKFEEKKVIWDEQEKEKFEITELKGKVECQFSYDEEERWKGNLNVNDSNTYFCIFENLVE